MKAKNALRAVLTAWGAVYGFESAQRQQLRRASANPLTGTSGARWRWRRWRAFWHLNGRMKS
ncbi:MAG: hypothetical protein ACLVB5_06485 [Christensenellales bacterium]